MDNNFYLSELIVRSIELDLFFISNLMCFILAKISTASLISYIKSLS